MKTHAERQAIFEQIESKAAEQLNRIAQEEIFGKEGSNRYDITAAIEDKLNACAYPSVTRAMLLREEYEPLIEDIIDELSDGSK